MLRSPIRYLISFVLWLVFQHSALAFSTAHLPLSDASLMTFPKLHATCFIIAENKTGLVLHEKKSANKIHIGTFDELVFSAAVIEHLGVKFNVPSVTMLKKLAKENNIIELDVMNTFARKCGMKEDKFSSFAEISSDSKMTLQDMCLLFKNAFNAVTNTNLISTVANKTEACFFKSAMSGVGCAFRYKNEDNNCEFFCVLYGATSKEDCEADVKAISLWLSKFTAFKVSNNGDFIAIIPVFYGKENKLTLSANSDDFLLVTNKSPQQITKVSRYRTMVAAPIYDGDELGYISYRSEIFKNPIQKPILATKQIDRAGRIKTILDSFLYIIFGTNEIQRLKNKNSGLNRVA